MSGRGARLRLVYAEYESGRPPYAWLDGRELPPGEQLAAHRLVGHFARAGERSLLRKITTAGRYRTARGRYGTAVRTNDDLLLQTSWGVRHADGGHQGVLLVLSGAGDGAGDGAGNRAGSRAGSRAGAGWAAPVAARAGRLLAGAGIHADEGLLAEALEGSWAELARPFPVRRLAGWFARFRAAVRDAGRRPALGGGD
ncbi:hypothetical protein Sru01_16560 [Sphaerisporangium rufum]|uniref:Uncharacterized protein n=1 Tax=Sphaerisporangium rufum TaxID=1381558 RepID=A0A919QYT5_9ACTN|nr:hypothetical protein [Sphaerisporangium rufum]GII76674.1 hypothetical protein Sru01_16560 [Sphaerisporangium rufum]